MSADTLDATAGTAFTAEQKEYFAGFMAGYSQFFGTKTQPNRPARSAMQVAALAAPGALIEIEVIAVRRHSADH